MQAIGVTGSTDNLRMCLRGATASAHDLLDASMRAASGWSSLDDYADFLALQHAARAPVEDWLAETAPQDLVPPAQCPLIANDLADLGHSVPPMAAPFSLHIDEYRQSHALGAAWVLAGSSLGNRSILKELRRAGHVEWPHAFLGDDHMLTYWQGLRRRIERPAKVAEVEAASAAAAAVFDHFLRFAGESDATDHRSEPTQ
ncbi:MAG: biliverdin-producing heme oxygenase [Erythrobacter sp.]|nr:biliverdin-producing heme oxygenase [Erythrobacter sp.]